MDVPLSTLKFFSAFVWHLFMRFRRASAVDIFHPIGKSVVLPREGECCEATVGSR